MKHYKIEADTALKVSIIESLFTKGKYKNYVTKLNFIPREGFNNDMGFILGEYDFYIDDEKVDFYTFPDFIKESEMVEVPVTRIIAYNKKIEELEKSIPIKVEKIVNEKIMDIRQETINKAIEDSKTIINDIAKKEGKEEFELLINQFKNTPSYYSIYKVFNNKIKAMSSIVIDDVINKVISQLNDIIPKNLPKDYIGGYGDNRQKYITNLEKAFRKFYEQDILDNEFIDKKIHLTKNKIVDTIVNLTGYQKYTEQYRRAFIFAGKLADFIEHELFYFYHIGRCQISHLNQNINEHNIKDNIIKAMKNRLIYQFQTRNIENITDDEFLKLEFDKNLHILEFNTPWLYMDIETDLGLDEDSCSKNYKIYKTIGDMVENFIQRYEK